jgi:hypothetical protein
MDRSPPAAHQPVHPEPRERTVSLSHRRAGPTWQRSSSPFSFLLLWWGRHADGELHDSCPPFLTSTTIVDLHIDILIPFEPTGKLSEEIHAWIEHLHLHRIWAISGEAWSVPTMPDAIKPLGGSPWTLASSTALSQTLNLSQYLAVIRCRR